jgi:RND family efflux transporter MFP subunit
MKYKIPILIIVFAVLAAIGLYSTSPKTRKAVPTRPVPLVEVVGLHPVTEKVFIEAFGTVIPSQQITLQSEVEGRIIDQNPDLIPGGLIPQGNMVVQIDPADYELRVSESMAELEEAMFELELEQGKQVIAGREWELMENEIDVNEAGKSLALREPHLRLVKARVEKARSRLAAAELELKRTTIGAPFNALVLEEFVDSGQLVSKQTTIATLAGTDRFRVQVPVMVDVLTRISGAARGQNDPAAQVIFEPANGPDILRNGRVLRIMGDLDPEGRMARVLIEIDDPLNLDSGRKDGKILLGSYVKVKIEAGFFENVYSIPRQALREGDVIWVQDSGNKLQIRPVSVVWRRKNDVLVNAELGNGDRLILSRLQSPLPGIKVRGTD